MYFNDDEDEQLATNQARPWWAEHADFAKKWVLIWTSFVMVMVVIVFVTVFYLIISGDRKFDRDWAKFHQSFQQNQQTFSRNFDRAMAEDEKNSDAMAAKFKREEAEFDQNDTKSPGAK